MSLGAGDPGGGQLDGGVGLGVVEKEVKFSVGLIGDDSGYYLYPVALLDHLNDLILYLGILVATRIIICVVIVRVVVIVCVVICIVISIIIIGIVIGVVISILLRHTQASLQLVPARAFHQAQIAKLDRMSMVACSTRCRISACRTISQATRT